MILGLKAIAEGGLKMSTKGASNRYGNTSGSNHRGMPTKHINYAYAKAFNEKGLKRHFKVHGVELGFKTKEAYEAKAIEFANRVNRERYESVVDYQGTTYKFDRKTNML